MNNSERHRQHWRQDTERKKKNPNKKKNKKTKKNEQKHTTQRTKKMSNMDHTKIKTKLGVN